MFFQVSLAGISNARLVVICIFTLGKHFGYFVLNRVHFRPSVSEEKMFNSFYINEIHVDSPLCICILQGHTLYKYLQVIIKRGGS